MTTTTEDVIKKAREEIESLGWEVDEFLNDEGEAHVVFTRDNQRCGWGMLDRVFVWTEAYEALTGKHWTTLIGSDVWEKSWKSQQKRPWEPCSHHGCLNHVFHPCEGCGRIGGQDHGEEV